MIQPIIQHIAPFLTNLTLLKLAVANHLGLGLREFLALSVLAVGGEVSFTQLHRLLSIPKSAVTQIVDRLSAKGLVERRHDSTDRRRWFVDLTSQGEELVQQVHDREVSLVGSALDDLSDGLSHVGLSTLNQAIENIVMRGLELWPRPEPASFMGQETEPSQ